MMDYTGLIDSVLRAYLKPATAPERMVSGLLGAPDMLKGAAQSAYSGATLPGDVVTGKTDPNSPEGFARVQDLAGLLGGSGYATEKPAGAIGMFAGRSAKTADLAKLATAEKMAAGSADRQSIWDATGWFQGADGKWRFEIPDHQAELRGYIVPGAQHEGQLSGVMKHRAAYMAYDDLPAISTTYGAPGAAAGSYFPPGLADEEIRIGKKAKDPLSTALHETQHAIQQREGFATGASGAGVLRPNTPAWEIYQQRLQRILTPPSLEDYAAAARFPTVDEARDSWKTHVKQLAEYKKNGVPSYIDRIAQEDAVLDAYERSAGEVEARAVQKRQHLTPEQRAARAPWLDYDVPLDKQIVTLRGLLDK